MAISKSLAQQPQKMSRDVPANTTASQRKKKCANFMGEFCVDRYRRDTAASTASRWRVDALVPKLKYGRCVSDLEAHHPVGDRCISSAGCEVAGQLRQTPRVEEGRRAVESCLRLSRIEISFLREQEDNIKGYETHEEHRETDGAYTTLDGGLT